MSTQSLGKFHPSTTQTQNTWNNQPAPLARGGLSPVREEHEGSPPENKILPTHVDLFANVFQNTTRQALWPQVQALIADHDQINRRIAGLEQRNAFLEKKVHELSDQIRSSSYNQEPSSFQANRSDYTFPLQHPQNSSISAPHSYSPLRQSPPHRTYTQQAPILNPNFRKSEITPPSNSRNVCSCIIEQEHIECAKQLIDQRRFEEAVFQLCLAMSINRDNQETSSLLKFCEKELGYHART